MFKARCVFFLLILIVPALSGVSFVQAFPSFEGLIEPSEVVNICSQVAGTLEKIFVERGDHVRSGQAVARLHSSIQKAAVDLATARMEFGKRKVLRNEDLHRKNLISLQEKDEMETELRISELQLNEAREHLNVRTIRSPIDGFVVERFLSAGEYIGEEPILKIAQLQPLFVEVVVPSEMFGKIKKGMTAEVAPEFGDSQTYPAKVIIVDRMIDAASGTFGVRLELPNKDGELPAGLKCKVVFPSS